MENIIHALDWFRYISLLQGMVKHGRLHCFTWVDGPTGYDVERILRRYDIHAYGRGVWTEKQPGPDGKPVKHLRKWMYINHAQAEWTEYLLMCAQVPIDSPMVNPGNRKAWGKPIPGAWRDDQHRRNRTAVEALSDFWAGLTR